MTTDGSPHGARTIALWEPRLRDDVVGENGAPVRRSAGSETARMMADLVSEGARTLTFVRSRRGAELTALAARARLVEIAPHLQATVASYRSGYLAEDRRSWKVRWPTASCGDLPPPTPWNWGSTSQDSMRS